MTTRLDAAPTAWAQLMTSCVACERHCTGIVLDRTAGVVPRAFSYGDRGEKRLAVVFGEPGSIAGRDDATHELRLFATQPNADALFRAVEAFTYECFRTGTWSGRPNPFHRRVRELLIDALGSVERVLQLSYFTNLTKCEKSGGAIPPATRSTCFGNYLEQELRILRPGAALLFGGNAAVFAPQIRQLGMTTVLADHPSARPPAWLDDPARAELIAAIRAAIGEPFGTRSHVTASAPPHDAPRAQATHVAVKSGDLAVEGLKSGWIRAYLQSLLEDAPTGTRTSRARNGPYPGVRITGGAVLLELYAHPDYIRVGIVTTDPRVRASVLSIPGFQVIKPAKKWYTGYIRDARGIAAIERLLRGPA